MTKILNSHVRTQVGLQPFCFQFCMVSKAEISILNNLARNFEVDIIRYVWLGC